MPLSDPCHRAPLVVSRTPPALQPVRFGRGPAVRGVRAGAAEPPPPSPDYFTLNLTHFVVAAVWVSDAAIVALTWKAPLLGGQ